MTHAIGQANNAFCFPGIGLGAVVAEARVITDELFLVAADALASCVSDERLSSGAVYPPQHDLRRCLAILPGQRAQQRHLGGLALHQRRPRLLHDPLLAAFGAKQ